MADDLRTKLDDVPYERNAALYKRLGVSENSYARVLENCITHAIGAPPPAADPVWVSVGPRNLGGRIVSLAQHRDAPNTIFAGSAHGGLWRSIDRGDTWERLGATQFVFPVGALAIAETASTVLYVGTGSMLQSYVSGRGLFRVLLAGVNGAATFEPLAGVPDDRLPPALAPKGASFRYTRIRVDPDDAQRFWVASQTGLWRCEIAVDPGSLPTFTREFPDDKNKPEAAKLIDDFSGGISWPAYATDVLVARDPRSDDTADVTDLKTGAVLRKGARYLIIYVGINGKGVWRGRFDRKTGKTAFDSDPLKVPDGVAGFRRVRLAQCARKPEHVFAVVSTAADDPSEVYRSSDNGGSWKKGATAIPGHTQAEYDLVLECSPDDPSALVCGAVELGLSADGGDTWSHILDSSQRDLGDEAQHADQHIAMFDVADNRRLWVGNDGGLSLARDLDRVAQTPSYWRKRSHGIFAGQFQDITASPFYPFASGGGLQDNGTWVSYGGATWYYVDGGDGGMMAVDHADPHQLFATWQGSNTNTLGIDVANAVPFDQPAAATDSDILRISLSDIPESIAPGGFLKFRTVDQSPAGNNSLFVGIIEQHPTNAGQLLAGRVADAFGSANRGGAWTSLLAALPAMGAAEEAQAVAFGPVDANAIPAGTDGWVGTDLGQVFVSPTAITGGWALATGQPAWPGGNAQPIGHVLVHPNDRRLAVICATGIPGRVFITYDRGLTWTDITEPIPTAIAIVAVAGSLEAQHTRQFLANATYADGSTLDVTTTVTWTTSAAATATVGDTDTDKGRVTGVAAGNATITASWTIGVAAPLTANQAITIVAKTSDPNVVPVPPARRTHRNALPPGPIASAIFDPTVAAGAQQQLIVGTLAGLFILPAVPSVTSIAISPAGPFALQQGAPNLQLSCIATYSDGSIRDVSAAADWSVVGGAGPTVTNGGATPGLLTPGPNLGLFTIQAARGTIPVAQLQLTVQAAAIAPPALGAAQPKTPPPLPIAWRPFGQRMPLALVTDFSRVAGTNRLRAATFGLGIHECDLSAPPKARLFIRQTVIDDGRVTPVANPRAIPTIPAAGVQIIPGPAPAAAPINDPRLPQTGPRSVPLDFTHAFDIRVDAPPYSFFDDVLDAVEFDEQLRPDDPVPTEINYVYVQLLNGGMDPVGPVTVHLYVALCDAIPAIGTTPAVLNCPATLDAAAPIGDFYTKPDFNPIAGSKWSRVDGPGPKTIKLLAPDDPQVVRFTWIPDASLEKKSAALLALCNAVGADELPNAPAAVPLSAFILNERRAALRIVSVGARPPASVYIRDGVADDAHVGGYPVAGRSPDIMCIHPGDISGTPEDAFKDLISRRPTDSVTGTGANIIYVRVHNRRRLATKAKVKVFVVPLDDANTPNSAPATWAELPAGAAFAETTVPPLGVGYARIELPHAGDPNPADTAKAYLLVALIKSDDDTDVFPSKDSVDSADAFFDFVSRFVDSDNAASRALPWVL